MNAEVSVLGLYNYDTSLFENMNYPASFAAQDKTDFVDNLLMELAELEVIYTSPDFMKMAIGKWSAKELPTWERIYRVANIEYNPLENYDRQESESELTDGTRQHSGTDTTTNSGTDTVTNSGTDTTTNSGTDTEAHTGTDTVTNSGKDSTQDSGSDSSSGNGSKGTTRTGADTTTNNIAGYDSGTLVTHDTSELAFASGVSETTTDSTTVTHGKKTELTHGHVEATQHGESIATTHGHVEAMQHGHVESTLHGMQQATLHGEKIEDDISRSKMSRIHGNIGVTTSQAMAQAEVDVAPKLNVMNYMIESFKNRFCILVW